MNRHLLLFLILLLIFTSCKKVGIEPGINKFTPTDADGNTVGEADQTDWTQDGAWSAAEKKLFQKEDSFTYGDVGENIQATVYPASPNPCRYTFTFSFTSSRPTVAKFALVDKRLNILSFQEEKYDGQNQKAISFNVSDRGKFNAGKT
jgi:hypothetical protein